jgi:hypothetical protein
LALQKGTKKGHFKDNFFLLRAAFSLSLRAKHKEILLKIVNRKFKTAINPIILQNDRL